MTRAFIVAAACLITLQAQAQSFQDFIIRVNIAPEQRRQYMVDSMLATVPAYPFTENDTLVWFFYKGSALEVAVAGDMNYWSDVQSPLQRLSTTDLWYRRETLAPDTRVDYKFIVDDSWILDPRNPFTVSGGFGPNSELRMPEYMPPEEIQHHTGVPQGRTIDTTISSSTLHGSRPVKIYLPPGYAESRDRYPVVLFHDGLDYYSLANATNILDNLIFEQRIPPCIAVFVPAIDRAQEYAGAQIDAFTSFIVDTVMHHVDAQYRTRSEPHARAMIGSSNGGNIALYIAMKHPEMFGCVGAQSSNIISAISSAYAQSPALPVRVYLDLGVYDITLLVPLVQGFRDLLQTHGYDYLYQTFNEGHSWGSWRAHIDDALEFFFAGLLSSSVVPSASEGFNVGAAWPNPAAEHITLPFAFDRAEHIRVALVDVLGRELRVLYDGFAESGPQQLALSLQGVTPGAYLLRVTGSRETKAVRLSVR